jgi:hypothetical protein
VDAFDELAGKPLTPERLEAAARKIREQPPAPPHGTPENPHLISPSAFAGGGGFCITCDLFVSSANPN